MADKCSKSGCFGDIIDGVCEDCGRLAGGKSVVAALADGVRRSVAAVKPILDVRLPIPAREDFGLEVDDQFDRSDSRRAPIQPKALGAGLLTIEPLPKTEPEDLIIPDAQVPADKRSCGSCNAKLRLTRGFCPKCGLEYSIVPTLARGDIVANQYEIKGPIAFGGLGWIYLAWDKVLSRLVILKGLLNSKDEISAAAALQERRYLAAVKHPNIVGIYNFAIRGREGYIVMEFVSGRNLKQIRQDRGSLPVVEAIAFILRILAAFAHLHKMGLLYCDFKPDNFMYEDDDVKLIDMGAVRRIDDHSDVIFCTRGYAAPEAAECPSIVSDLYTVGRTLAVLVMNFDFQKEFEHSLPSGQQQPILEKHDSLLRFLLKATNADPARRFQSAEDMADQLLGVLCECTEREFSHPPFESQFFEDDSTLVHAEARLFSVDSVPRAADCADLFPVLRLDTTDSAFHQLRKASRIHEARRLKAVCESIAVSHSDSREGQLRLADAQAQVQVFSNAESVLKKYKSENPGDWRADWYMGKLLLLRERPHDALECFEMVYSHFPGELAPKLAIAMCAETACDLSEDPAISYNSLLLALRHYATVGRCDHGQVAALFGLARCMLMKNERSGSIEALKKIPSTSTFYTVAQTAVVRILIASAANEIAPEYPDLKEITAAHLLAIVDETEFGAAIVRNEVEQYRKLIAGFGWTKETMLNRLQTAYGQRVSDFQQAAQTVSALGLEGLEKHRLRADILLAALHELAGKPHFEARGLSVLNSSFYEKSLRNGAEKELRSCARHATSERERIHFIDSANLVRPLTFI